MRVQIQAVLLTVNLKHVFPHLKNRDDLVVSCWAVKQHKVCKAPST